MFQPKPKFTQRYNPQQKFNNQPHDPDRFAPIEQTNKTFLRLATDASINLNDIIVNNNTNFNVIESNSQFQYVGDVHKGKTALHFILSNVALSNDQKFNSVKSAIQLGAPIDSGDNYNVRPLHLAAQQQNSDLVNLLLEQYADPNSKDNQDMTPLHYALRPKLYICPSPDFSLFTKPKKRNAIAGFDNITNYLDPLSPLNDRNSIYFSLINGIIQNLGDVCKEQLSQDKINELLRRNISRELMEHYIVPLKKSITDNICTMKFSNTLGDITIDEKQIECNKMLKSPNNEFYDETKTTLTGAIANIPTIISQFIKECYIIKSNIIPFINTTMDVIGAYACSIQFQVLMPEITKFINHLHDNGKNIYIPTFTVGGTNNNYQLHNVVNQVKQRDIYGPYLNISQGPQIVDDIVTSSNFNSTTRKSNGSYRQLKSGKIFDCFLYWHELIGYFITYLSLYNHELSSKLQHIAQNFGDIVIYCTTIYFIINQIYNIVYKINYYATELNSLFTNVFYEEITKHNTEIDTIKQTNLNATPIYVTCYNGNLPIWSQYFNSFGGIWLNHNINIYIIMTNDSNGIIKHYIANGTPAAIVRCNKINVDALKSFFARTHGSTQNLVQHANNLTKNINDILQSVNNINAYNYIYFLNSRFDAINNTLFLPTFFDLLNDINADATTPNVAMYRIKDDATIYNATYNADTVAGNILIRLDPPITGGLPTITQKLSYGEPIGKIGTTQNDYQVKQIPNCVIKNTPDVMLNIIKHSFIIRMLQIIAINHKEECKPIIEFLDKIIIGTIRRNIGEYVGTCVDNIMFPGEAKNLSRTFVLPNKYDLNTDYSAPIDRTLNKIINPNEMNNDKCYDINTHIIAELIAHNAFPNSMDSAGGTPLRNAIIIQNLDAVEVLLNGGANVVIFKNGIVHENLFDFCMNLLRSSMQESPFYKYEEIVQKNMDKLKSKYSPNYTKFHHNIIIRLQMLELDEIISKNFVGSMQNILASIKTNANIPKQNNLTAPISMLYKLQPEEIFDRQIMHCVMNFLSTIRDPDIFVQIIDPFEELYAELEEISTKYFNTPLFYSMKFLKDIINMLENETKYIVNIIFVDKLKNEYHKMQPSMQFNFPSFTDYCSYELPKKLVKSVLKIQEFEDDNDINQNVETLLNDSLPLMQSVDKEFINKIKETIIPYAKEYMELFIQTIYNSINSQLKSFIEQKKLLQIAKILAQKAIYELNLNPI